MTDIRRYQTSSIMIAAQNLRQDKENETISDIEYALELNTYRFRDLNGTYWFLDPLTEQWYDFGDKQWRCKDKAPNILEAPDLPSFIADGQDENAEGTKHKKSSEPGSLTAPEVLVAVVEKIRSGFEESVFSSTDVQRLLAQQVIIDMDGNFWTFGIQSEKWYRFKDRQWHKSSISPPEEDRLFQFKDNEYRCYSCKKVVNDETICPYCGGKEVYGKNKPPEKIRSALPDFLFFGISNLPEQVTEPWEPPLTFPDDVVNRVQKEKFPKETSNSRCPECNAELIDGKKFCVSCGAEATEKLLKPEEKKHPSCPSCGAEITDDLNFCTECGERLFPLQ